MGHPVDVQRGWGGLISLVKEVESKMKETIIRAKLSQGGTNLVEQLERKVIKMKEELEVERKQAGVQLNCQHRQQEIAKIWKKNKIKYFCKYLNSS